MKKILLPLFFFTSFGLYSQNLPNNFLNITESIPCPFDSNTTITAWESYFIYQTLDGKWDGPIDSSRCFNLITSGSPAGLGISMASADLDLPIFVRCKLNDDNKIPLYPNNLYTAVSYLASTDNNTELLDGLDCPGNLCSGLIIGIEIPDESGDGTVIRWHTDVPDISTESASFETCVPTEYFSESYLRHFIIKMWPAPSMTVTNKIMLTYTYFFNPYGVNSIENFVAPEFTFADTSYQVDVDFIADFPGGWWSPNFLLLYDENAGWPSTAQPSYVEAQPEVNSPEPKTINLIIDDWETYHQQPFSFLRGSLVEGSDSIRHHVNLVNEGGDICMSGPIDFVFDNGTNYVHHGGQVDFGHRSACFMFQNGGSLIVADQTTFHYGQGGKGIMALRPGSTIQLGKGSTLVVDNTLWLQGRPTGQFPDHQIYMELNRGSRLEFTENAHVLNSLSFVEGTKLNVYMNGGILDDSKLPPASRALINRIYPKPQPLFSENVKLLQNPVGGSLLLSYLTEKEEALSTEVYNLHGQFFGKKTHAVTAGANEINHAVHALPAGAYLVKIRGEKGEAALKFFKAGL